MASTHPDLAKILNDAGFPAEACEYLLAKGIRHTGVLANMAADTNELYTKLDEPLAAGWSHQGSTQVLPSLAKDLSLIHLRSSLRLNLFTTQVVPCNSQYTHSIPTYTYEPY